MDQKINLLQHEEIILIIYGNFETVQKLITPSHENYVNNVLGTNLIENDFF